MVELDVLVRDFLDVEPVPADLRFFAVVVGAAAELSGSKLPSESDISSSESRTDWSTRVKRNDDGSQTEMEDNAKEIGRVLRMQVCSSRDVTRRAANL